MADENKKNQNPDELENLSPEELQDRIQEEKKNAKRSLRFAITALIAIIAVCIAWFAANNRVSGTGTNISAKNDVPFELASVGERQKAENEKLIDEDARQILSAGTAVSYNKYIDTNETPWAEKEDSQEYHVGTAGLALYLEGQQQLAPGSSGKIEFYLIPKKTGLTKAKVSLNMEGYKAQDNKAVKLDNPKIQNLLKGHILFFRNLSETKGYSEWLEADTMSLEIKAPDSGFKVDVPYKVTIYWKWPQYFRNYIYTSEKLGDNLFTNAARIDSAPSSVYNKINTFVNNQKSLGADGKLFYSSVENSSDISDSINDEMNDTTLNQCVDYYNQADEYVGMNVKYVHLQIQLD